MKDSLREEICEEGRGRYVLRIRNEGQLGKIGHDFQFKNIFDSDKKLRIVMCYNEHENNRWAKEGGTCAMVFDELKTMVDSMYVEKTKLRRWVWVKMVSKEGHTTRVIPAYQPVQASKKTLQSI